MTWPHNWGDERLYYQDDAGVLHSVAAAWASLATVDPFVNLAADPPCPWDAPFDTPQTKRAAINRALSMLLSCWVSKATLGVDVSSCF